MKSSPSFFGPLRVVALASATALLLGACAGPTRTGAGASPSSPVAAKQQILQLVPTEPPSDLGPVKRFAWQQVVQLGETFARGDAEGFLARVSSGFYRSYATLESSLKALLADSSARTAVVAIRSVTDEEGKVSVRAEWTRSVTLPDGSVDARHGETVFLFLKSDTNLRLLDYRGDAPFAIAGI